MLLIPCSIGWESYRGRICDPAGRLWRRVRGIRAPAVMQRITSFRLAQDLGRWSAGRGTLHIKLAQRLEYSVRTGQLPPNTVLPSERSLAIALSVSRTTVARAYATLRDRRLLVSRQGSGTWVASPPGQPGHGRAGVASAHLKGVPAGGGLIDLTNASVPGLALVSDVVQMLPRDSLHSLVADNPYGYALPGYPPLREAIAAEYCAGGLATGPAQILITSGTQQALALLAQCFLDGGHPVVVEGPTYRGALGIFRSVRARIHRVRADELGVLPEDLENVASRVGPRLVYLVSTVGNPTGACLPAPRRTVISDTVAKLDCIFVDDCSTRDTLFSGHHPPYLASYRGGEQVVTVGSMSKLYWSGLRVGWIRAPAQLINRLAALKAGADCGTSLVSQFLAAELLEHIDEAREERRTALAAAFDDLAAEMSDQLPDWKWNAPAGGASLWVKLPEPCATAFAQAATHRGVAVTPGPVFSADFDFDEYIRIPFGIPVPTLRAGVLRIAETWMHDYRHFHGAHPVSPVT